MPRTGRLFEIIQILRSSAAPVRAEDLAEKLEVSKRTIYRDISALQAMRTPVEGEAGIGYMLRKGYDLPPLNFDEEELEALHVGLAMLMRTGDGSLQKAAERVSHKIKDVHATADWLQVAPWGAPLDDPELGCVSKALLRKAVRDSRKLRITYVSPERGETSRTLRPLALIYHIECTMLAAWCELRGGFRHFRTDRMFAAEMLDGGFAPQAGTLRKLWMEQEGWDFAFAP
ncbi:helix-turn-helix transcriptional regulator [Leisingera methylohalidivorans]|uniref:Transcriptional regulator n=1 Tax=Leisingera methylohalidivorans DSM 14336 TaxID=999552 RepID=V9VV67_9RHOB|nr:YafY family protein [Leisingera methylohalidivorans]AHD01813.1 transcriptional regulator [Leisingera methylohalidivorans DSM 14336]